MFKEAEEVINTLTGADINAKQIERLCHYYGQSLEDDLLRNIEVNAYQNEIDRLIGELENAVGKHAQVMHEFEKCDIDLEFMRNKCAALTEENKELLKQIVESDDKIANLNENYGSLEKLLEKIAILKSEKSQLNEALRKQTRHWRKLR